MTDDRNEVRVLLAEDSRFARREIARDLRAVPGVEHVVAVGSVAEAREVLAKNGIDVCVLDFRLGDGTALDVLRDRSTPSRTPPATFVVFTGAPSAPLRRRCLEAGADHFLVKPDDMKTLLALVKRIAGRQGPSPPA
ncbi:MAG: response regulator [Gemmatimonadota bacterium]